MLCFECNPSTGCAHTAQTFAQAWPISINFALGLSQLSARFKGTADLGLNLIRFKPAQSNRWVCSISTKPKFDTPIHPDIQTRRIIGARPTSTNGFSRVSPFDYCHHMFDYCGHGRNDKAVWLFKEISISLRNCELGFTVRSHLGHSFGV
jgi:hypothetical protein